MGHGEIDVEHADQLRVALDHIANALPGESLLPESGFDLLEDLGVTRAGLVKHYSR